MDVPVGVPVVLVEVPVVLVPVDVVPEDGPGRSDVGMTYTLFPWHPQNVFPESMST